MRAGEDEAQIEDFDALVHRVETVMEPVWRRCLELGIDVVLDMGFWARAKRDGVRSLAGRLGATTQLHYVHCPAELAWPRVERRNLHLPDTSIRMERNTFDVLRSKFEPLEEDEDHLRIETYSS